MVSGPPLERFENSSDLDEFGPSQGTSGGDTKSFSARLSFARSQQSQINFSFFLPEASPDSPARASRGLHAAGHPHRLHRGHKRDQEEAVRGAEKLRRENRV